MGIIAVLEAPMSSFSILYRRICSWVPGHKAADRSKMPKEEDKFEATEKLMHRYADVEVLRKCLIDMDFKEKDIKISVRLFCFQARLLPLTSFVSY